MPKSAAEAGALGARTARACDGCMRRRARWHCSADDAFLCQACDASVHSANPLARRHQRVRLPTSSSLSNPQLEAGDPAWLHGLKRRARTPRTRPAAATAAAVAKLTGPAVTTTAVPDLEAEEADTSEEQKEEELLCRVPVFDPMLVELCNLAGNDKPELDVKPFTPVEGLELSPEFPEFSPSTAGGGDEFAGFHVSDSELTDFAADVESLLNGLMGDGGFGADLGFLEDSTLEVPEQKPEINADKSREMELERVLPVHEFTEELQEEGLHESKGGVVERKTSMMLTLDYEGLIATWSRVGHSPWFHGERPQLDTGDPWPDFQAEKRQVGAVVTAATGGEREARVSRYREKRRTRLFAKKIRYEVRKLNAEKRPRMKGRFVKRAAVGFPPVTPVPVLAPTRPGRFPF